MCPFTLLTLSLIGASGAKISIKIKRMVEKLQIGWKGAGSTEQPSIRSPRPARTTS